MHMHAFGKSIFWTCVSSLKIINSDRKGEGTGVRIIVSR